MVSTASFILKFDRYLLPSTATRQSLCIQADIGKQVRTLADCVDPILLEPTYNPVLREVIFRLAPDQRLARATRYALTVLTPSDESPLAGFRAFDGTPLQQNVRIEFTTRAEDPRRAAEPETPPGGDLFCRRDSECANDCAPNDPCLECVVGAARYLSTCAYGAACHQNLFDGAALSRGAAEGLNLDLGVNLNTLDYIRTTAIGHVAHQTQTGEHAHEGDESSLRFGRAMPIIDPRNPGNSYLLYKLIVGPNGVEHVAEEAAKRASELDRLRASVVVGMPMPPPQAGASFTLIPSPDPAMNAALVTQVDGMDILTAWIASGAAIRDCSAPPFN